MSRKKRNKYFFKEKEIIRLKMNADQIRNSIRNQGWIELEEPVHHGYNAEWTLRDDILRRDDSAAYKEALNASNDRIWSKNPDFKYKNRKTKRWEIIKPKLKKINKASYDNLSPTAKKFFYEDTSKERKYWRYGYTDKSYICTLSYELVMKITKSFITHRKEHDGILYQMDAENDKMLYQAADGHPWSRSLYPKWHRKHENKKIKLKEEKELLESVKGYNISA